MATVHNFSGSSSSGGSAPRGPTYQVATRELSADFSEIGPDQEARELGAVDGTQFSLLLEQLCAIDPLKLVDADPQLLVTVKSGRFLIQPQGGKLLVRPAHALDQMFFKLSPAEIPAFLDGSAPPVPKPAVPTPTTLIGSAAARAAAEAEAAPASAPAAFPTKKKRSLLIPIALGALVLVGAGSAWIFLTPPPAPPPRPPVAHATPPPPAPVSAPAFDPVMEPTQLLRLQERFGGTYATSGDAGERLFEVRADHTFSYREFGSSLAVTVHESGSYTFAYRHGTQTPVLRAGALGAIELRDEHSLVVRGIIFTHLPPAPAK